MEQEPMPTDPKEQQPSNSYLRYSGFAFQLLGGVGFGAWAGHQLDEFLDFEFPLFLLLFMLIIFSWMLYQISKRLNQD